MLRQHDVDLSRLLRRARPDVDGFNRVGGSGASDEDGKFVLLEPLFRESPAQAKPAKWDGSEYVVDASKPEVTIATDSLAIGYWFEGDVVRAERTTLAEGERWLALGAGIIYVSGTTGSAIAKGATGTVSVRGGKSITVLARYDAIGASKKFGAWWDDYEQEWHASGEC